MRLCSSLMRYAVSSSPCRLRRSRWARFSCIWRSFGIERVADRLGLAAEEQETAAEAAGVARLRLGAGEHVRLLAKGALVAGPIGARPAAARLQMGKLRLQAEAALRLRDAAAEKGEADDAGRNEEVETVQRPCLQPLNATPVGAILSPLI